MSNAEYTKYYLEQLQTAEWENAFHSLMDGPTDPQLLIDAFNNPAYQNDRSVLVQLIGIHAGENSLETMRTALRSDEYEVWNQAISVLVTWNNTESKNLIEEVLAIQDITGKKREYLQEALEMLEI